VLGILFEFSGDRIFEFEYSNPILYRPSPITSRNQRWQGHMVGLAGALALAAVGGGHATGLSQTGTCGGGGLRTVRRLLAWTSSGLSIQYAPACIHGHHHNSIIIIIMIIIVIII